MPSIPAAPAREDAPPPRRPVRQLNAEVARKIAAGEVIDRPNAIVRELMDNAVDSGATSIAVELTGGGIEKVRVIDNGCGMAREDLAACARPHATSKIDSEADLLHLSTLGFRGEALASMAAVSRLEIISGGWKMNASVTEDHVLTPAASARGTIVQTAGLFENFPARRQFLKRPASEGALCRTTFEEKALPRPDIAFRLSMDGEEKLSLPAGQTLAQRFVQALELFENERLFYDIGSAAPDGSWSFRLIIGEPSVSRSNRKNIYVYVNGRRITEYSLLQAIEYGGQGYFPNGTHPVACLFVTMDAALVDFNIHPAKREARFKDTAALHHAVSTATRDFFKQYTVKNIVKTALEDDAPQNAELDFAQPLASPQSGYDAANGAASQGSFAAHPLAADGAAFVAESPGAGAHSGYQRGSIPASTASYSQVRREPFRADKRSSFFGGAGRGGAAGGPASKTAAAYAERIAGLAGEAGLPQAGDDDDSAASMNAFGEDGAASVEGRTTRPNYLPGGGQDAGGERGGFHFVGSTLGNFLIAEKDDILYIIDQHAAHERYLYNQIMEKAGERQALLVPYAVQTGSPADDAYLEAMSDTLRAAGFTGRNCGGGRWEFSTVPVRWKGTEADLARDLLDRRIRPGDMINAVAASTACRTAVMDGDVLDAATAARIAEQALQLPDPHCPHGRPVYTTITRRQLFALVKRI